MHKDITEQYRAVRDNLGWFDRSRAGRLAISGADCYTWLQGMVSNDVRLVESHRYQGQFHTCVLNATGHILTDMTLVRFGNKRSERFVEAGVVPAEEFVLADLPGENTKRIRDYLDDFIITEDVEIADVSAELRCFALQGPAAHRFWELAAGDYMFPLSKMWPLVYSIRADYTGERGFNAYVPAQYEAEFRAILAEANVAEIGEETQEILRLEAGIPRYGADMDETTIALEANLGPTHISLTKGCYVGQEIVARIASRGHTNRALTGLVGKIGETLAPGAKLYADENGSIRETGRVTSSVPCSPAMDGRPIALGYVRHEHREPGSILRIGEESAQTVTVVELPFYRKSDG